MPWCQGCDRYFLSTHSLKQHLRNSNLHSYCDDCDIYFETLTGLKEHWVQSPNHDYCQHCDLHFDDEDDLEDHYESEHIWCRDCNRFFRNQQGLHEHRRQSPYHSHLYCVPCKTLFQSENNLRSHQRSSIHQPRNYLCPGNNCGQGFVSTSALVLHFESGACPSGMTRSAVNKFVRQYDRNNVIADPARMIGGGSGYDDEVTYYATRRAWNGDAYECYLCHNEYGSLRALNQHLTSSRHQNKIYVCPWSDCRSRFSTLSAFCQHVESERCGILRFSSQAQRLMNGLVSGMRTIAL
ncbi:hypothetical protein FA15DRAFT_592733 [Coprinopsis marcescibilis]|uniref:C2H2-type domain-containing protein n=1 Tax=Coprinopsis marcescibilis TaxID=230819 RepID=A0A5C3KVP6_COPMA|nr:hypothetical protein FA15DRAFT_592733 [Coprinopsis marcescibilis]